MIAELYLLAYNYNVGNNINTQILNQPVQAPVYSTIPGAYDPITGKLKESKSIDFYKKALKKMGVKVVTEPIRPEIYEYTYDVLTKLNPKGKKMNVKLDFAPDNFEINNPILNDSSKTSQAGMSKYDPMTGVLLPPEKWMQPKNLAGGAWFRKTKTVKITANDIDPDWYRFKLAHELGHSIGIGTGVEGEDKADAFAAQFYPGHYYYKNNPLNKSSWQVDYIPPQIINMPAFPSYY